MALFEYSYSRSVKDPVIGVESSNELLIENFIEIAVSEFKIEPNKIIIEDEKEDNYRYQRVYFYNSKLKKLLIKELEKKDRIFKYRNDYSSNYLKGIYDSKGSQNKKGIFIEGLKIDDAAIMERLNFHTLEQANKSYILNKEEFLKFIKIKE
ncbi:MAG: hypothetical protein ACP5RI_01295 [Candidatus Micrarchaeia archaeon]